MNDFLPISRDDMKKMNIDQLDFVFVTGDAYVDHPSFAHAIISRVLVSHGYTVGIISQPDWRDSGSVTILGKPRLAFLVSSGNMDSMVNHYTVARKRRGEDAYSPGGRIGLRPDRASAVYSNLIRSVYKDVPIILGGIEASLRRLSHYDYWSDKIRRSVLLDSGADIISYGMGEKSIVEIAEALEAGISVKDLCYIRGTVFRTSLRSFEDDDALWLPSYENVRDQKEKYAESFMLQYENTDPYHAKRLVEAYEDDCIAVVQNPPAYPLSTQEMDDVYELPYTRTYHPVYEKDGGVPAAVEIKFSITSNRGCFGGCSFCALNFHQGRIIQSRSAESILREARELTREPDFKGYIHDIGGATANFYHPACEKQARSGSCKNRQCLYPKPCGNLNADHSEYVDILRRVRSLPGIKKVFIRSGVRFDYMLYDDNRDFLNELCAEHISGQLRVAPEHISDNVLKLMGKPPRAVYDRFLEEFKKANDKTGKKQFVLPYLMSSHPGSTLKDAILLACYIKKMGFSPRQVQDFYPTPSTLSTVMYYTGFDPRSGGKIYVAKTEKEKKMQRALIQYADPKNYNLVREALLQAGREDLIGFDQKCLIKPENRERKIQNKDLIKQKKKRKIRNIHKKAKR